MDTRSTSNPKQSKWSSGRARYAAVGLVLAAASALVGLGACQGGGGRFPTCKSDADCTARESKKELPVCVDLRCVECRSDTECPTGHACNLANECRPISDAPSGGERDAGKEVIEKESWEPSSPEDREKCLAACKGKGKECTDRCGGGGPAKKPPAKK